MSTPKDYLDGRKDAEKTAIGKYPGCADCYYYSFKGKTCCYSFDFDDALNRNMHIVSFDVARDGKWFGKLLGDLVKEFGDPFCVFERRGIVYFEWKEAIQA